MLKSEFPKSEYADIVLSELKQIENIANELLYLSKPKEPTLRLENLSLIIEETINLLGTQTFKKHIEVYFDKRECEEINVLGDKTQLKQVFLNLIKNAIEAIRENGKIHFHLDS